MRATVMMEGKPYYKVGGSIGRYPKFVPEDYVILRLNPRFQKGEWVQWMQEMPPGSPPELLKAAETFSNLYHGLFQRKSCLLIYERWKNAKLRYRNEGFGGGAFC